MVPSHFHGRVVVVTGGASGIGRAMANKFGEEGGRICLLDADREALYACEEAMKSRGMEVLALPCDVTEAQECIDAVADIIRHFGGIDILINNAGITQRSAFVDTGVDVYRRVMDVNFYGSLHCTKAAIGSLIERRGMIIVTESIAGVAPLLGRSGYCASKHALHGLFTTLRSEMRAHGVHVMIVCPGFIRTNLQSRALGGDGQVTRHPQSRVGKQDTPEHAADAIYKAALKRKHMLVLTGIGKLSYWISRLFPAFYERLMARKLQDELIR